LPYSWEVGPGEGWLDIFPRNQFWMQIQPRSVREAPIPTASPTADLPGAVGAAETCFEDFDGEIHCVLTGTMWEQQYRDRGAEEVLEVPTSIPPTVTPVVLDEGPAVVVPSDPQEGVSEASEDMAVDWGTIFSGAVDIANAWGQQPVTNFLSTPQITSMPAAAAPGVAVNGSCGCNSNPCVCGTINGRPALVDPRTGKRCYRRRRRVMLTEGDFNTLLRIATLPNNANVRTALAKAIGRR